MKKFTKEMSSGTVLVWLSSIALFCLLGATRPPQNRVATINADKVFDKYWRTAQVMGTLKDYGAKLDKTYADMVDKLKKDRTEYQNLVEEANDQAVSASERDRRKQTAEDKKQKISDELDSIHQFEKRATATIAEQKSRLRKSILDEIKVVVRSKAQSGGYSIVIDSGAQTYVADPSGAYYSPSVLYSSDDNDLTDAVIAQLNQGKPPDLPKADDRSGESKPGKK